MTDGEVETLLDRLLDESKISHDRRIAKDLLRSALDIGRDSTSTLNLKIASSAIAEMREAFARFAPFVDRKKVTIFGSARTTKDDPLYRQTEAVAAKLAQNGWMVMTGAGPG
ncbi:MAG: Rossman fold protein, TIGR00730 family, partial [Actinomycetota bacterium]